MDFYGVLQDVAQAEGMSLSSVGQSIGKNRNYIANAMSRGSDPSTSNAAAMLAACGWSLAALPASDLPPSALVIDAPAEDKDAERRALERKRDRLRRELADTEQLLG